MRDVALFIASCEQTQLKPTLWFSLINFDCIALEGYVIFHNHLTYNSNHKHILLLASILRLPVAFLLRNIIETAASLRYLSADDISCKAAELIKLRQSRIQSMTRRYFLKKQ